MDRKQIAKYLHRSHLIALTLYCLLILWLSLKAGNSNGHLLFSHEDKLFHFGAYAIFSILFCSFLKSSQHQAYAVVGLILLGGVIELLQALTGYREASWIDEAANTLGVVCGLIAFRALNINQYLKWKTWS